MSHVWICDNCGTTNTGMQCYSSKCIELALKASEESTKQLLESRRAHNEQVRADLAAAEANLEIFRKAAYESGYQEAKSEAAGDALEARRLLWLGHGHSQYLYGDDGEMQCIRCGEHAWDYKRMPLENIVNAALAACRNELRFDLRRQAKELENASSQVNWREVFKILDGGK